MKRLAASTRPGGSSLHTSEREPATHLRSAKVGEAELACASLEGGSAFDERDVKKGSIDIRLFWSARHHTRRKKSVTGR